MSSADSPAPAPAAPPAYDTLILPVDPAAIVYTPPNDASTRLPVIDPASTTYNNLQQAVHTLTTTTAPVAFPTETVYGLGASGLSSAAARNIYAAKNRPADNPLILHISALDQLKRILHTDLPPVYEPLVKAFWPGPLTIILPVPAPIPSADDAPPQPVISPVCTHGQSTFAVRMPAHPVARALIALADTPLAAPSANASTRPSPTRAAHVYADLRGRIPLILDGGACEVGVESTVVDGTVSPPRLLRPGGVSLEQIKRAGGDLWKDIVVGPASVPKQTASASEPAFVPRTPGMKYKHYSPSCPVYLYIDCADGADAIKSTVLRDDALFQNISAEPRTVALLTTRSFDPRSLSALLHDTAPNTHIIAESLGDSGAAIARNLFDKLREMDEDKHAAAIIIEGVSTDNEGLAIMNRLCKAATHIYRKFGDAIVTEK